ncbi:hypothetical protein LGH83_00450 [Lichenihabitans sp. PAMC28606]|uniref:hypothetical protein n=1 Tax=Lichenihabitans sp. PAMC28606 TaxID=2880932 RepID=UPI001D0AEF4E|nr:hypothetical protein [Lichenihabitans sp. PAMC28606]UDL94793.1 hypothetical protein LGH83_00450 [Lichenihabitans sp. PAMC28606]
MLAEMSGCFCESGLLPDPLFFIVDLVPIGLTLAGRRSLGQPIPQIILTAQSLRGWTS